MDYRTFESQFREISILWEERSVEILKIARKLTDDQRDDFLEKLEVLYRDLKGKMDQGEAMISELEAAANDIDKTVTKILHDADETMDRATSLTQIDSALQSSGQSFP